MIIRHVLTTPTVSHIYILSTIQHTTVHSLHPVLPSIVSRRLAESWLRSQRPLRRLSLTPQHRRNRLERCCRQSSWLKSNWHLIVFTDEYRFNLEPDDHHLRV
ncbi:transposable element Tcb2 transposase [Trichonephila clavipes]|nr:transposable element Tcb2 transposase [Trichonephila clavipes]